MAEKPERKFAKDFLEKWARAEREEGPADEALRKVEAELKERPDDPNLWFRQGTLLLDLERWQDALDAFRRVESLDPNFARLYVALAFVLGKLGRFAEAVDAQRKAIAAVGGEAPQEAQGIEQAFASLSEELFEQATEERVVRDLEELGEIAREPAPVEEDAEAKLRAWEAAGFDVAPLREVLEREPDRARTAVFQFEQNVRKVQILRDTVDVLSPEGLEGDIARVRALFAAPYQIWKIEAEMATLLEKADARDRAQRARTLPPQELMRAPPRATGATNGRPPTAGRVNGLTSPRGRVNGQAGPLGRVNGLAKVGAPGRVNGLVNGFRNGRAGLTNGLTNGMGITNGLGGRRFALEARARRVRLFLVPMVALALLFIPLLQQAPVGGGLQIDGSFADWTAISGYRQDPSAANPNVDLVAYKVDLNDRLLSVYAAVRGSIFTATQGIDEMRIFVDADGSRSTGYDNGRLGADVLLELAGYDGTIAGSDVREWNRTMSDREDWNGWVTSGIPFAAAASGSEVEAQIDFTDVPARDSQVTFNASRAQVSMSLDDEDGSASSNAALVGTSYGALVVTQSPAFDPRTVQVIPAAPTDFMTLRFRAIGGPMNVSGLTLDTGAGTPPLSGFSPFGLAANESRTVTLRLDGSTRPVGTLVNATVSSVDSDAPVTIVGKGARAYISASSSGPVVDGLFGEWRNNQTDPSPPLTDPNVDIVLSAGQSRNTTAFAYASVRGDALGGTPSPQEKVRPSTGGGASAPPGPPSPAVRRSGEDTFRVYYHDNGTAGGVPIGGIVANVQLEVRGHYGRVRSETAFVWSNGWQVQGTAKAIAVADQIEASIDVPGIDLRGAQFVIQTRDWKGIGDLTLAAGVRGTRSTGSGIMFLDSYRATLPLAADGAFRFATPSGLGLDWRLPNLFIARGSERILFATPEPVPIGTDDMSARYEDAYAGLGVDVAYAAEPGILKETFTFPTPPNLQVGDDLVLDLPIQADPSLMVDATGVRVGADLLVDGTLSFIDGHHVSIDLPTPWIADAGGNRLNLHLRFGGGRISIVLPSAWLLTAQYPVVLDPTITYTLRNDGPIYKAGEQMGWSVAVGDFNGDGYADVLTGAPANSFGWSNNTQHGAAYIYYGPFTADRTTPDVNLNGTGAVQFGYAVAAGKFNNDAYWDALVSRRSNQLSCGSGPVGPVSIFYGSASFDTTADVEFTPPSCPKNFGQAVGAGNVDNANYDDVFIAEPGRDNDANSSPDGVVYAYKSPFSSSVSTANYTLLPQDNAGYQLGLGGIAIGKVDSDADPDVVVGEPSTGSDGRVDFYKGSHFTSGSGNLSPDAYLSSQSSLERFGASVSVGKLNGDAYEDIAVGAPAKSSNAGAVYLFTANGDGSGITSGASPATTIPSQSSAELFGTSVRILDFTDDGSPGVAVGAPNAAGGGTARGRVYWFNDPLNDVVVDETMTGAQDNEKYGQSLAGGKFTSDTKTILAIGAYLWDKSGAQNDGRAVVASVPEPAPLMLAGILIVGLAARSLQRRRLVRHRRELRL